MNIQHSVKDVQYFKHAASHTSGGSDEVSLAASQITSGTLSTDRIPSLSISKVSDFPYYIPIYANLTKSDRDSNGIFQTCTWELPSSKVVTGQPAKWTSVLSSGTSPKYTYRTVTIYGSDKSTVVATIKFSRTYNSYNDLVSETYVEG